MVRACANPGPGVASATTMTVHLRPRGISNSGGPRGPASRRASHYLWIQAKGMGGASVTLGAQQAAIAGFRTVLLRRLATIATMSTAAI